MRRCRISPVAPYRNASVSVVENTAILFSNGP
jgi:hypothetical protein